MPRCHVPVPKMADGKMVDGFFQLSDGFFQLSLVTRERAEKIHLRAEREAIYEKKQKSEI
jgi:hypothetical protein